MKTNYILTLCLDMKLIRSEIVIGNASCSTLLFLHPADEGLNEVIGSGIAGLPV